MTEGTYLGQTYKVYFSGKLCRVEIEGRLPIVVQGAKDEADGVEAVEFIIDFEQNLIVEN